MSKTKIFEFNVFYQTGMGQKSISVNVFIQNLSQFSTATVHSTVEFGGSWFICYSVLSYRGLTEYFYELVSDSDESNDYVLNLEYDSGKAVYSFNLAEKIVFVDSDNDELQDQTISSVFHEDVINDDFKIFLVISQNTIVLFWNNRRGQVVVKTLDLSSFIEFEDYDFTRVVIDSSADFLYDGDCSIRFCEMISPSNTYYSVYVDIKSFLEGNGVLAVLNYHEFNQMCTSQFSGSQFKPEKDEPCGTFNLKLSCSVDGSEADSEADSDDGSEADSDDGSEADSAELNFQRDQELWEEQLGQFKGTIV